MNQLAANLDEAWHNFDKATEQLAKAQAGNEEAQQAIAAAQAEANTKKTAYDNLVAEKTAKEAALTDIQSQIAYWEAQRTQAETDRDDAYEDLYGTGDATNPALGSLLAKQNAAEDDYNNAIANDAGRTAFYTEFRDYVSGLVTAAQVDLQGTALTDIADADLMNYLTYDQVKGFDNYPYTTW